MIRIKWFNYYNNLLNNELLLLKLHKYKCFIKKFATNLLHNELLKQLFLKT